MRFGILGTGVVGRTLGSRLVGLGHHVRLGSRTADNAKAAEWASAEGEAASHGTFADAADYAESVVMNATSGQATLDALAMAGAGRLAGKVLVDVANPLDFSAGFPPRLFVCNDDSLAEQVQRLYPDTRVVKALNTVTASVMVDPDSLGEPSDLFICGDDEGAKELVRGLLDELGWRPAHVIDLGGVEAARATEMYLPLWLRLMQQGGSPSFNVRVVR